MYSVIYVIDSKCPQVRFEDPLGGTTAAEDLIESFGFQGEVEETPARPRSTTSPSVMGSGRPRALTGRHS